MCVVLGLCGDADAAVTGSVTYQADAARSGFVDDPALRPPLKRAWSRRLGEFASAPLVVGDRVFVTATGDGRSVLYALDRGTGETLWQRSHLGGDASYDAGRLFVSAGAGLVQALDPATGATLWTVTAGGLLQSVGTPLGAGGLVHLLTSDFGTAAGALRQSDGGRAWTTGLSISGSLPAVADGRAFYGQPCNTDAALLTGTGAKAWEKASGCDDPFSRGTGVVHDGRVYTPGGEVRDLATGDVLGTYHSVQPPAFSGTTGVFVEDDALIARDVAGGAERWRHAEAGLGSPPLIAGGTVYAATHRGELVALDLATGAELDREPLDSRYRWSPRDDRTGLGAGGGTLVVPTEDSLTAFVPEDAPVPAPPVATARPTLALDPILPLGGAGDDARAVQQNRLHDGFAPVSSPRPPLRRRWKLELEGASQPLIADGKVFALVDRPTDENGLRAFDQRDGSPLWRARLPASENGAGAAYDAGRVFVSVAGTLRAFDASTGRELWRTPEAYSTSDAYEVGSAPIAFGGVVYVGSNSALYAVSEADGHTLWRSEYLGEGPSVPASDGHTAWLGLLCGGYAAIDVATHARLASRVPCSGGGNGQAPVMADGRVALSGSRLLEDRSDRAVDAVASSAPPAFAHGLRFTLNGTMLEAAPSGGGAQRWEFRGDGSLATPPVVSAGMSSSARAAGASTRSMRTRDGACGATPWAVRSSRAGRTAPSASSGWRQEKGCWSCPPRDAWSRSSPRRGRRRRRTRRRRRPRSRPCPSR